MILTVEFVAITLSIVAVVVTVTGFVASLKVYRDGVKLQEAANRTVSTIQEKIAGNPAQAAGRSGKRFDAQRPTTDLGKDLDELDALLKETRSVVRATARSGEEPADGVAEMMASRLDDVERLVATAKRSAADMTTSYLSMVYRQSKLESDILYYLYRHAKRSDTGAEGSNRITEAVGADKPAVRVALGRLVGRTLVRIFAAGPDLDDTYYEITEEGFSAVQRALGHV